MIKRPPTPIFSDEILSAKAEDSTKIQLSDLYRARASLHMKMKDYTTAKEDIRSSLELNPENESAVYIQHECNKKTCDTASCYRDFLFFPFLQGVYDREFKETVSFHEKVEAFATKVGNITVEFPQKEELSFGSINFNKFTRNEAIDMMKLLREYELPPIPVIHALVDKFKSIIQNLPNIVYIDAPKPSVKVIVVGDTHGQFQDLLYIFDEYGYPSPNNPYLFNGDFVDRGSMGLEILIALFAWKIAEPHSIYLNRGNHETISMNRLYGFEKELATKCDTNMFSIFSDLFCYLPVGHVIGNKVIVVHGGLFSSDTVTLKQIQEENRVRQPPEYGPMNDILWSDPMDQNGHAPSPRGITKTFGPDITEKFLAQEGLDLLIRSHQMQMEGYLVQHNGKCITVFSAPNYVGRMGNKGAVVFLSFDEDGNLQKPEFQSFDAQPIPEDYRPMKYFSYGAYF